MGYVDKQIAAAQQKIGDAVAGKGLRSAIRKLQEKAQIVDSLKALPARGAISAKRSLARRTVGDSSLLPPFTEVAGSRVFHTTERTLWSTDGLFALVYFNTKTIKMRDSKLVEALFHYDDYAAS